MEFELWSGNTKAVIDPRGAWVTNLSDEDGDILFPRRSFALEDGSKKVRGGMHVCVPQFGPGGESGLVQHGFVRDSQWEVVSHSDVNATLQLAVKEGAYSGLVVMLQVTLDRSCMAQTLSLRNESNAKLRIAPAFHPYFATGYDEDITINGDAVAFDELVEAQFDSGSQLLATNGREVTVESSALPQFARWTDRLGRYICVEPTMAGFAFLRPVDPEQLLAPGVVQEFGCKISWKKSVQQASGITY